MARLIKYLTPASGYGNMELFSDGKGQWPWFEFHTDYFDLILTVYKVAQNKYFNFLFNEWPWR